ncbi:unnamed protein product [Psylliodes chrysocephalus]|uniref:DUF4371 domain-containing protein n=1 Tax=Psylliodes chrysocephalus TaxID=3402493 RepID=A0A9P0CRE4_9CUCU|nr:unnamed protein product [Psylliodes chrysocephala]
MDVINILRNSKCSLIIDESTDRSCTKHLALICRYFQNGKIFDGFLRLIPIRYARAEDIYNITTYFQEKNVPYKTNLVGFASDGANVMTGKYNSVMSRMKEEVPDIFLKRCICHSFHLCASAACEKLPRTVEDVARDIYNYISNSPKTT